MRRISIRWSLVLAVLLPYASAFGANLAATADAYIDQSSGKTGTHFGSNGITAVSSTRITLVRFDANQVAQSVGSSGRLNVKVLLAKNQANGVAVRLVLAPWNETTVTANSLPALSPTVLDQKTITTADQGKLVSFDVSNALSGWRNNPASNFGLALVPVAPTPNLQLGSREGGSPAVLAVNAPTADSDVTVAPSGRDYTSPRTAAENALNGDKWCVSPSASHHCKIHVKAGIYVGQVELPAFVDLLGEDRGETQLLGSLGIGGSVISDLTIIGGIGGGFQQALATLERVNVRATLRSTAAFDGFTGSIIDSSISVVGVPSDPRLETLAFDCGGGTCGTLKIIRSQVSVTSPDLGARVFEMSEGLGSNSLDVEDSTFSVFGKTSAQFLSSTDEYSRLHRFVRTSFAIYSAGTASGFSGNFFQIGLVNLQFIDCQVDVQGGASGGFLDWRSGDVVFDGSTVNASNIVAGTGPGVMTVLRSRLTARDTVLALIDTTATIENSYLQGTTAVIASDDGETPNAPRGVQVNSSVLAGQVTLQNGVIATCTHVYDADLALRQTNCASPPHP